MTAQRPLRYAVIEITNACNLRCSHCASTSGKRRANEFSFREITELLGNIAELGGEEITIIGGEALLREDWFEICEEVNAHGMRLILISNGILIKTEETLTKINRLRPYLIGISIDGASRQSYIHHRGIDQFEHVISLLYRLTEAGHKHVNAITTFMQSNLYEFDTFADLFDNTGITWQVQLANRGGKRFEKSHFITKQQFAWFVEKMKDVYLNRKSLHIRHMDDFGYCPIDPALQFIHKTFKGCIAGKELIGVRSNGDLSGCLSLGDEFIEVNLRDVPLKDIWISDQYFRRTRYKEAYLRGHCRRCPFARNCLAGCTSIAFSATGTVGYNPYCIRSLETESILKSVLEQSPRMYENGEK